MNPSEFQSAKPFPHFVADDYWNADDLRRVVDAIPTANAPGIWQKYQKNKRGCRLIHKLPYLVQDFFAAFTSPDLTRWLEAVTGIEGLIPDTTYAGAGLHAVGRGGSLGVHVDFNELKKVKGKVDGPLYRRLNTFLYLNRDWEPGWGGGLGLYDPPRKANGTAYTLAEVRALEGDDRKPKPGALVKLIQPTFNRFVAFETTADSWHGHPEPLRCPVGRERLSLSCYWYTRSKPPWHEEQHSTIYVK